MVRFEKIRRIVMEECKKFGVEITPFLLSNLAWLRAERKIIEISKYLPKNSKVLDIGCGDGYNTLMLKTLRDDLDIVGIEPFKQSMWDVLKRNGCNFEICNALRLKYKDNSFDAVVSFGVMEHLKKDYIILYKKREFKNEELRFMQEIHRVLKSGGINIISNLPNKYSLSELIADIKGISKHPRRYTKKQIQSLLNVTGFKKIKIKTEFFIPSQVSQISRNLLIFFNKHHKALYTTDKIINHTPLNLFSQSYFVVCKK